MTLDELIEWAQSMASADDAYQAALTRLSECDGYAAEYTEIRDAFVLARMARGNVLHETDIVAVARAIIEHMRVPPERHFGRTQWDKPEGQS